MSPHQKYDTFCLVLTFCMTVDLKIAALMFKCFKLGLQCPDNRYIIPASVGKSS